jgi:hypothetical protein
MSDRESHKCIGLMCEFVVDTGEGLVCTQTGIVVGDVLMASFEYLTSSSVCATKATSVPTSAIIRSTMVTPDVRRFDVQETRLTDDLYGECFRVISRVVTDIDAPMFAWRDALVVRCVACCGMCLAAFRIAKTPPMKTEYLCLATLYLIREGLTVQGTVVCLCDVHIAKHGIKELPSLNALTRYGFIKGKYTKASRFLLQTIDKLMLSRPLHQIHI